MIPNIRTNFCLNCEVQANTIEELRAANKRWAIAFQQAEERAIDAIKTLQADREQASERIEALRLAVVHYDAALKSSWPYGAKGDAWEHWNEARIILQETGETFTHPDNV